MTSFSGGTPAARLLWTEAAIEMALGSAGLEYSGESWPVFFSTSLYQS